MNDDDDDDDDDDEKRRRPARYIETCNAQTLHGCAGRSVFVRGGALQAPNGSGRASLETDSAYHERKEGGPSSRVSTTDGWIFRCRQIEIVICS